MEKTIEVESYFGKVKQLTKQEYRKRWMSIQSDLYKLAYNADSADKIAEINQTIAKLVDENFDYLWNEQQKKEG